MRSHALGATALLLFLGLSQPSWGQNPADASTTERQPTVSCGECHDLAKAFTSNPHARGQVEKGTIPNAGCETCHGDGTAHIEAGGDVTKIAVPRGRKGADETCVMCHDVTSERRSHRTGMHANSEVVNCLSCHSIHHSEPRAAHLLSRAEPALCSTCHATQVAEFRNKPYTHRLGRAGLGCSSCHEVHGRPADESLKRTKAGERVCLACHTEVRGPFVFPHGASAVSDSRGIGSAGDCQSCHQPHGSTNPKQLKRTSVAQLCIECHSPLAAGTLGSQPPAFHDLLDPRYQNCTTCHVAIHGSNRSPALFKK